MRGAIAMGRLEGRVVYQKIPPEHVDRVAGDRNGITECGGEEGR